MLDKSAIIKTHLQDNTPSPVSEEEGGYAHYQEKVDGHKIRARSESFKDHFSQATMFWNSMSEPEKLHIVNAFSFELGKCKEKTVREQVVEMLVNVEVDLASQIAKKLGLTVRDTKLPNYSKSSPALSQLNSVKKPDTRKIAVLVSEGFDGELIDIINALKTSGTLIETVSDHQGNIKGADGSLLEIDHTFSTADSVLFDAVYVASPQDTTPTYQKEAAYFVKEAYAHFKPIAATFYGVHLLDELGFTGQAGVISKETGTSFVESFIDAIANHRFWNRAV